VLKGLFETLRRNGLLGARQRELLVILNHNPADPKQPDDVSIFGSVEALVGELRTVDLLEDAYLALDTTGRLVTMTPTDRNDPDSLIVASLAHHPSETQLARRMLQHYLITLIEDEALDFDRQVVVREHQMENLVKMVPGRDITG
jgi:hypothetical protein